MQLLELGLRRFELILQVVLHRGRELELGAQLVQDLLVRLAGGHRRVEVTDALLEAGDQLVLFVQLAFLLDRQGVEARLPLGQLVLDARVVLALLQMGPQALHERDGFRRFDRPHLAVEFVDRVAQRLDAEPAPGQGLCELAFPFAVAGDGLVDHVLEDDVGLKAFAQFGAHLPFDLGQAFALAHFEGDPGGDGPTDEAADGRDDEEDREGRHEDRYGGSRQKDFLESSREVGDP